MKQSLIIYFLLSHFSYLWADNYIFDLDGVVLHTSGSTCLRYMGVGNLLKSMAASGHGPIGMSKYIKTLLTETLEKVAVENSLQFSKENLAFDKRGQAYPGLMCAWLNGDMTNEEIHNKIIGTIYAHGDWFKSTSERDIIINSVNMIFIPERFASTRRPFRKAVRYIKSLKSQGHSVYVLSNWDAESFDLVQKIYPEIFGLFDGILISGNVHALKPTPSIYAKMLEQYGLDPDKSWFIDDQDDNIKAAQDLDINGILCTHSRIRKKPDFRQVRNDIKRCQCLNGDM